MIISWHSRPSRKQNETKQTKKNKRRITKHGTQVETSNPAWPKTRSNSRHTFRTYATFACPHYSSKSFVAICTIVSYRAHANSLVNDKGKKKKKKHVKRRTLSWIERERKKKRLPLQQQIYLWSIVTYHNSALTLLRKKKNKKKNYTFDETIWRTLV